MESNSDKAMREKLQGFDAPFDPAAWEQMEAMLNKDEKKRGFFWWWFGAGMAALLLLSSAGAYLTMHHTHGEQLALNSERTKVKGESAVGNEADKTGSTQGNIVGNGESIASTQLNEVGNKSSIGNNEGVVSNVVANTAGNSNTTNASESKNTKRESTRNPQLATRNASSGNGQLATNNSSVTRKTKSAKRVSTRNSQLKTSNPSSDNEQLATGNSLLTDFNGKPIASQTAATTTKDEAASLDKYWLTYLNPTDETYSPARSEGSEELPKKMRAKVFQYSMGVLGNVSASMVKESMPSDTSSRKGFTAAPSYSIGFTHDFLFANRFAISNSIIYSQSNFKVKDVMSEAFRPAPLSFNTRITELAIPIGIKVYAVAKPKVRFYISAGIINHIKLSETFTYNVPPKKDTSIASQPTVTNNYPYETSFTGTGTGSVETNDGYTLGPAGTNATTIVTVNSNEFSINNAKRYYASFYAGAGVEGVIKNKWILFAEPSFSIDLQKIGIQERRKYNIGANLGFRYQF